MVGEIEEETAGSISANATTPHVLGSPQACTWTRLPPQALRARIPMLSLRHPREYFTGGHPTIAIANPMVPLGLTDTLVEGSRVLRRHPERTLFRCTPPSVQRLRASLSHVWFARRRLVVDTFCILRTACTTHRMGIWSARPRGRLLEWLLNHQLDARLRFELRLLGLWQRGICEQWLAQPRIGG